MCNGVLQLYVSEVQDADAKIPSGALEGDLSWLGAYDECMNISAVTNSTTFKGEHCLGKVDLKQVIFHPFLISFIYLIGVLWGAQQYFTLYDAAHLLKLTEIFNQEVYESPINNIEEYSTLAFSNIVLCSNILIGLHWNHKS